MKIQFGDCWLQKFEVQKFYDGGWKTVGEGLGKRGWVEVKWMVYGESFKHAWRINALASEAECRDGRTGIAVDVRRIAFYSTPDCTKDPIEIDDAVYFDSGNAGSSKFQPKNAFANTNAIWGGKPHNGRFWLGVKSENEIPAKSMKIQFGGWCPKRFEVLKLLSDLTWKVAGEGNGKEGWVEVKWTIFDSDNPSEVGSDYDLSE